MSRFPLMQAAYEARSHLANAQACENLYAENNPQDAPFPITHYPSPGLDLFADYTGTYSGSVRGLYAASDDTLFAAIGQSIVHIHPDTNTDLLATTPTDSGKPVVFCDNGTTLVAVDGTSWGGQMQLGNFGGGMQTISDPAFYGANRVDFIDTFLIFNQQGTQNFYTTTSNIVTPFDPLYFASKAGWNDRLVSLAALHDNIWLLGAATSEIWFNAGGSAFPFARMPNSILQQGCVAVYSVVVADNAIYWLSQDRWGRAMMMRGEGYAARRISTFAVEDEWSKYQYTSDCRAMAYQIGGHETVGFYFPSANTWWAYDASTQLWHKRTYADSGAWLPQCCAYWGTLVGVAGYNAMMAGSWAGPQIYMIDRNAYTDAGTPITRRRRWPHTQTDGFRAHHSRFALNMQGSGLNPDTVNLAWSDDAGETFGGQVAQTINNQTNGQYQWRRLGYTRDRVYDVEFSGQGEFAINGAWLDVLPHGT